jgi:hypothetical protein
MPGMLLAVVRVWLDDRPGSLASVAGQIGTFGGDLIGIDVLERGGGRVIDEFVVELPDTAALDRIISAVDALDGVDVELAEAVPEFPDPRLDALELAGALVSAATGEELLQTLVSESRPSPLRLHLGSHGRQVELVTAGVIGSRSTCEVGGGVRQGHLGEPRREPGGCRVGGAFGHRARARVRARSCTVQRPRAPSDRCPGRHSRCPLHADECARSSASGRGTGSCVRPPVVG